MKQYPKIEYHNKGKFDSQCIAFDKLDGSNIRFEWSKKRGFYKFGTRNTMIDIKNEQFGQTIDLFLNKYNEDISRVFYNQYKKVENFVVFAEYVGENSFAGWHDPNDKMDIILFDVNQYKRGFIPPFEFLNNFGHLSIPTVIYNGKYTQEFIDKVKRNDYSLKEGVIAKGTFFTKKDGEEIWQVKIKTNEWLNKVKSKLGVEALKQELNNDKTLITEYI